jgi:hypothetical protein
MLPVSKCGMTVSAIPAFLLSDAVEQDHGLALDVLGVRGFVGYVGDVMAKSMNPGR